MDSDNGSIDQSAINLAFCANDRFLPGLQVTLYSTLQNLPRSIKVQIHVLDAGLSDDAIASLTQGLPDLPIAEIRFYDIADDLFASIKATNYHIAAYMRLALPELLDIDSVIYIDADIIVFDDIRFLNEEMEKSSYPVAAVPDWETESLKQDSNVIAAHYNLVECTSYFNSGVLALNLASLRIHNFTERSLTLLAELGTYASFADQSAFNALLADTWHALPKRWNMPSWAFDQQESNDLPAILHFTNSAPWLTRRFTPSQALFERIARDLGVVLPQPEVSLFRSCANAIGTWLIAPVRVAYHGAFMASGSLLIRKNKGSTRKVIVLHWLNYFLGGPVRVVRYWTRIRQIKSSAFGAFCMKAAQ